MDYINHTAIGRYYKVYSGGVYVSQHTTEREALQKCTNLVLENFNADVKYVHEYEVTVKWDSSLSEVILMKGPEPIDLGNVPPISKSPGIRSMEFSGKTPFAVGGGSSANHEDVLTEMVGFAKHYGCTGGAGRPLITVTNLNNSGAGSLRQAISDASSGAWIRFAKDLGGEISLSSLLNLNSRPNITIDGRGANITIAGSNYAIRATSSSANNFILMYLKVRRATVDIINIDFGHTFWFYHVTITGPQGDGGSDLRKSIGRWTIQETHYAAPGGKSILLFNDNVPNPYNATPQEGTIYRTLFETTDRHPRVNIPAHIHMYNNYSHGMNQVSVALAHIHTDSAPAEMIYEHNIVNADNGFNGYFKADGSSPVNGKARKENNLELGGAFGSSRLASEVFIPPYEYSAATATTGLRDSIISSAGWQNVPFPGD